MAHLINIKRYRDFLNEREFNTQELVCKLRTHFGGQFICFKLDNENSLWMVLFRQVDFLARIKHCFHRVSCGHIWRSTSSTSSLNKFDVSYIIWCQRNSVFLCSNLMLHNVIETLCIFLDANDFRISFMEYNSEDYSFKPKHKNKNFKEQSHSFTEKLCNRMRRNDSLFGTSCVMTSDKPLKDTNAVKSKIISTHINKKSVKVVEPRSEVQGMIKSNNVCEVPSNSLHNIYFVCNFYPLHGANNKNPHFPDYTNDACTTGMSLQESIRFMVRRPDQDDIRLGLQSPSVQDERRLCDTSNYISGTAHTPMKYEESTRTTTSGQFFSLDGASNVTLEVNTPHVASKHEICISGSNFDPSQQLRHHEIYSNDERVSASDYRLPAPFGIQQTRLSRPALSMEIAQANQQQEIKQQPEASATENTRQDDVSRQRKRNDDLLRILGRVRSPENANFTDRLHTFTRWPSATVQTPAQVAEAGFYYTGLQDIVRCFACDGGLKNWDTDDDPWVEHARWFPQCAYVRHIKGEEFINLVRMMAEESDEEDDYTVHRGATWGGIENNVTNNESASDESTEPSVLENKAAQSVIEIGYSERHVVMAVNDILKKGKTDFTGQDLINVILEKEIADDRRDSDLSANDPPSVNNCPAADAKTISENRRLKTLLRCIECKTKERNILFLPCAHHVVCESCSSDLQICTSCYRKIKEKVRTYVA